MPNRRAKNKKNQEKMMWTLLGVGLVLALFLISLM
jgi:hypothetical protein